MIVSFIMGHYCFSCGEKLFRGYAFKCGGTNKEKHYIESVCSSCVYRMLDGEMSMVLQSMIKKEILNGGLSPGTMKKLEKWANIKPQCPGCEEELTEDHIIDY